MNMDFDTRPPLPASHPGQARLPFVLLALAALTKIAMLAALLVTLDSEQKLRDQALLTKAVMTDLQQVQAAVTDAETGQRGYVLTGDRDYLRPYARGTAEAPEALARLDGRLRAIATPEQAEQLDRLSALLPAKLAEMARTVERIEAGDEEGAHALVEEGSGLSMMREIRATISTLYAAEEVIFDERLADAERIEGWTIALMLALIGATALLVGLGVWQMRRTQRAEMAARDAEALRMASEQTELLNRELNHRVKNILAVSGAIVNSTLRRESDMEVAAEKVAQRLHALSVAHDVSQGALDRPVVSLGELMTATLAPYDDYEDRLDLLGEEVALPSKAVTPFGLILHELATNAVKYGAWSDENGRVSVAWESDASGTGPVRLRWHWREHCERTVTNPEREGFGSIMITMAARQMGATLEREWKSDGLSVTLDVPVAEPLD
ncbi:CHASE3 domain-containing protein [Sphingomicrobium nitratireducens]|uniref:CHASE3 domain-containing protein n=1 Tax=Sphingomicrobium nitratireducens TaxID=2964666 RepID=UPI0022406AAE|nr:CHASE3 domain-containing protein [Sphingomicrobium nitratireducens]